jgi:CelD/BcsL family acetyltransferase involved in cellulose biosynthesis
MSGSGAALRLVVAQSAREMLAFRSAWQRLESGGTVFQSFAWNELAARLFASRELPWVVYAETGNGVAIIPAALPLTGGPIGFVGEMLFDYRNVLAEGDDEALTLAWGRVAGRNRPLSVLALRCREGLRPWSGFEIQSFCRAPMVSRRHCSADDFSAAHSNLPRHCRRLTRAGVEMRRYCGRESHLLRRIYTLKAEQCTREPNLFQDFARVEFIVAAAGLAPDGCDIFTLESGSRLVAALVTFRDGSVRRFYTTYFDSAWATYSPGTVLLYKATAISLAEGLDCDYMTGEQPHKLRFATDMVPLYRVECSAETLAGVAQRRLAPPVAA